MRDRATQFWAKVDRSNKQGCWPFIGPRTPLGYGRFTHGGIREAAHRVAVELDGRDPTGMVVCHACDNPSCVNPAHLWLGSHSDNFKDMWSKGRPPLRGTDHGRAKLTEDQVRELRASTDSISALSRQYGVARKTIYDIRARRLWRHV